MTYLMEDVREATRLTALGETGVDPFVERTLFSMAKAAGLTDIDVCVDGYHLYPGRIDEHDERLWELKLDIALPIAARAFGSREAAKARFMDYLRRDDTLTHSVVFTVRGKCPS